VSGEKAMNAEYALAKNLLTVNYPDIPPDVIEHTKKQVLDMLGVMLGGSSRQGVKELADLMRGWGGKEESTVLCFGYKAPAPNAAQVNATMGHALDFDDTGDGPTHPSVVIVPTALAVSEYKGKMNGKDFIAAVALGEDMMCRLGQSFRLGQKGFPPGGHPGAGWHLTTLYGYLASAGVAGRILGLDEKKLVNAMGIAYHQCSGNGQCVNEGALTKRMGPGFSVRGGITAAFMAQKGITGAEQCITGELGIYNLYHGGKYAPEALTSELGKRFAGTTAGMKPFPCCKGAHAYVGLALAMVNKYDIKADDVKEITIFYADVKSFLLYPLEKRTRPENPVDAQFSIPWGVAAVFARRQASVGDYTEEAIKSKDILDMAARIRIEEDKNTGEEPGKIPAKIKVTTKSGKTYTEQAEPVTAGPPKPLPWSDYERKFRDCASYAIQPRTPDKIEKIITLVKDIEHLTDIKELIKPLS
jgi:2-methylcitrate dehydratase PrpD